MSIKYDSYLKEHRKNVVEAFNWLKENVPEVVAGIPNDQLSSDILFINFRFSGGTFRWLL